MCTGTHPFIPAPNTARVRMVYTLYGQSVMNVFYFQGDTPFDSAALSALCDEVHTAWVSRFKPLQSTVVELNYIEATALDTDSGAQITLPVNELGTNSGVAMPGGSAFAIKFASGFSGRSRRGRMYWIQLNISSVDGDTVNDTAAGLIQTAVSNFFDDITTALGVIHVVVSYCNEGAWRTTAVNTPILLYVLTDHNIDSQRRRLAGRGM